MVIFRYCIGSFKKRFWQSLNRGAFQIEKLFDQKQINIKDAHLLLIVFFDKLPQTFNFVRESC